MTELLAVTATPIAVWVDAPDCETVHPYGEDGWRPGGPDEPHEHLVDATTGRPFVPIGPPGFAYDLDWLRTTVNELPARLARVLAAIDDLTEVARRYDKLRAELSGMIGMARDESQS